jgi:hypothetical protein
MLEAITLLLAVLASMAQPQQLPNDWYDGIAESHAVVVEGYAGREWSCGDESCYAGWDVTIGWTTGP